MVERSFFTHELNNDGDDCEVFYDYDPGQTVIWYGDNARPGFPAEITINRVMREKWLTGADGHKFLHYLEIEVSADDEARLIELAFDDVDNRLNDDREHEPEYNSDDKPEDSP